MREQSPAIGHNSGGRVRCIFRAHGERGYTKLKNTFLQDKRISDETRGLVARLLSLPDEWEITVRGIISSGKAGRDKVYRMLSEAEKFGYVKPEQAHRDDGKFDRQVYLVSDDPDALILATAQEIYAIEAEAAEADNEPLTENPETAEPCTALPLTEKAETAYQQDASGKAVSGESDASPLTAKPLTEKPEAYKKNIEDNITLDTPPIVPPAIPEPEPEPEPAADPKPAKAKRKKSPVPEEYTHDFEEFWKIYPRREGKGKAFESWERLSMPQKRRAYIALKTHLRGLEAKALDRGGNFCPMPATWINQGRFDDEPAEPGSRANASPDDRALSFDETERQRHAEFMAALEA